MLVSDAATPQASGLDADDGPKFSFHQTAALRAAFFARGFINCETLMRISARNQLKGTVVEVKKGATTSHVRVDIGSGQVLTSAITNEAVDELGIKAKDHVTVVIKASDVMIAVE
jgi:molybdopterin-binding protein